MMHVRIKHANHIIVPSPIMWTVVVAIVADPPTSIQAIFVPFRPWLTDPITNLDTKGMVLSSDVLEKINTVEFITTLSGFIIADERVRVIRSVVPMKVKFHFKNLPVVLHVTFRLSPT